MRKNTKPQLRFPLYDSNWTIRKLKDVAPLQRGFDLPTTNVIEGKYPVVYSNGIGRYHNEFKAKAPGIVTGRSGTIGALTYVENDYWPHNTSLWVTDFIDCTPKFVFYLYQKIGLKRFATGSGVPTLNRNDVHDFRANIPELNEQQKIADFLTSVDSKISQLTEKHRLLKEYKKGVMQQIFSQQIRFKDKDGKAFPDWKTYPLKKVLSLQSDSLNMLDDETYELITVKRGFGGVVSRGLFKGKDVLVKNQFTIHENEFVISKRQIVHGACGLVPAALDGAIVSNEYNVFRPVEHLLDIDYFNRFATTPIMRRAFFINSDGVHIEKLLFKTQSWLKTKVSLPCLKEQQKIAQFLQSIDNKIGAVAEQIEQTKQFKKGLLQQMFV
ncbi:restriction endonuclease subunit S [Vibrio sp. TRT 2004]|uniref:restriction endonuclease subunit S n=1 Tax=Vibrio sp. TRT 2004 TaxID=3418506 RepID=UPI003CE6764B